ncbi:hypothetical protein M514_06918, partial [Trichuris suis]
LTRRQTLQRTFNIPSSPFVLSTCQISTYRRDISRFADIENVLPTGERITKLTEEPLDLGYKHFCEKVEAIKTYFSKISLPTRGL